MGLSEWIIKGGEESGESVEEKLSSLRLSSNTNGNGIENEKIENEVQTVQTNGVEVA